MGAPVFGDAHFAFSHHALAATRGRETMNKKTSWIPFFFLAVSFSRAEEISLSKSLELAQTQSVQVIQAAVNESRTRTEMSESDGKKYPQILAEGKITKSDDLANQLPDDNLAVLRAEQNLLPFLSPDWVSADQKASEHKAAVLALVETRQDVDLLVKQLYFSILRDEDAVKSLDEVEKELNALRGAVLPRFNMGRAPSFDLVKVKSAIADLSRTRDLTQAQLAGEQKTFLQVLGKYGENSLELKPLDNLPELPSWAEKDVYSNPTLKVLTQEMESARLGLDAANLGHLPSLSADFQYGYTGQTTDNLTLGWDAGIDLKLPLWDWDQVSSQVGQEQAALKTAQNTFRMEKERDDADLVQTQKTAEAYLADEKKLKELAEESAESSHVAVQRYRQGAMGIVEVSDAVNLWLQTVLNERNAFYSYLSALAKLERLTGGKVQVKYE